MTNPLGTSSSMATPNEDGQQPGEFPVDGMVLGLVLQLLEPRMLARARTVNKLWQQVASDLQVRRAAFLNHWQLLGCHGKPRHLHFFETAGLSNFVVQHVVQRTDTLQMLAVRHGCDVPTLKRVNNIMTDHSLHSRTYLFIPVASRQQLQGQIVSFTFCPLAARDFAVLRGSCHHHQQQHGAVGEGEQQLTAQPQGPHGEWPGQFKVDALQGKLCQLLGRSLFVDESTAKFYLEDANGDVKAAMEAFAQDVAWEGTTAGPIRTAPVQRWIRGEVGI